jgi:23S rRNA (cytosine1962-C5)-methyltransferase
VAAARHEIIVEDAFAALARLHSEGRSFDLVVIDPPAFAQSQNQVPQALQAYSRLTRLGLGVLQPGGILVQASCSSRVGTEIFYETILGAAKAAGRLLQEMERTSHPLDHPISFKEGEYLKCLFAIAP